jgi:ssRNA-specific RNase YbeY (16S rRNA maturation enzyme)
MSLAVAGSALAFSQLGLGYADWQRFDIRRLDLATLKLVDPEVADRTSPAQAASDGARALRPDPPARRSARSSARMMPYVDPTAGVLLAPDASPTPRPTVSAVRIPFVPKGGSGQLVVVPGSDPGTGSGEPLTYRVEIEKDLDLSPQQVATAIHKRLTDRRGWQALLDVSFVRTDDSDVDLRIILATPATTDELCAPLGTGGKLSCRMGDRVVLNAERWVHGAPAYGDAISAYRTYLVNHEVGHALGHGHSDCEEAGAPAPVMMQQTKGVGECRPNPWPVVNAT